MHIEENDSPEVLYRERPRAPRKLSVKSIAKSFLTLVVVVVGSIFLLRAIIIPVDTSRYNGHTAKEWIDLLASDDVGERSEARIALQEMGSMAVSNLGYALHDSDVQVRRGAVQVMYQICDTTPGMVDYLAGALKDSDPWVRWQAAKSLRRMGPKAKPATLALASAITVDPDARVRLVCIQSIERIGDGAIMAQPALIKALSDDQYYVRQAAGEAIKAVVPEERDGR